ncbi:MAG: hypothetical protein Q9202_001376 [Teloschistes flavicans]
MFKSVVTPEWVHACVAKGRLANPRSYSPDQRYFFSKVVLCCANIPEGDKDAVIGGVLAAGGLYSSSVTKMVTHIVALSEDNDKCRTALTKDLKCKIVLPHWFDDCLRLGKRLNEDPYLLPNPEILCKKPQDPIVETKKLDMQGASSAQPTDLPRIIDTQILDVFKGKKVKVSDDLEIRDHLRGTIEDLIGNGGGAVTGSVHKADVLICQYRESLDYRLASRAGKAVGNLAWLYYLITQKRWTSPTRRLLHYPVSKHGLPGFDKFRICLSNYSGDARVYLENLAIAAKAVFTKSMKEDNTHLITAHQNSEKCDAAREWNIHVVNHLWLEESYSNWQIMTLSNPRYTHFPPRTNLSEIVGQTQIDTQAVERHFYPRSSVEESEGGEIGRSDVRIRQQKNGQDPELLGSSQINPSSSDAVPYRPRSLGATPKASKSYGTYQSMRTPVASRINIDGKENGTPSSRGAKDRAAAKLHDQAADIALYEKERKRAGGVVFGGRSRISEDRISNVSRKRSSSKDEGLATDEDARGAKRVKKTKEPPAMRLLVTGYQGWATSGKRMVEDKVRLFKKSKRGRTNTRQSRLRDIGILVTQDPTHCTHLASPSILRTKKFVLALARGPMVISTEYVDDCLAKNERLQPEDYLLNDAAGEQKQGFKLSDAVSRAKGNRGQLFKDLSIYCTENLKGGFDTYKAIVEANGGTCTMYNARTKFPTAKDAYLDSGEPGISDFVYLLSDQTPAEIALWPKFRELVRKSGRVPRVCQTDFCLLTALRQELHWNESYEFKER